MSSEKLCPVGVFTEMKLVVWVTFTVSWAKEMSPVCMKPGTRFSKDPLMILGQT